MLISLLLLLSTQFLTTFSAPTITTFKWYDFIPPQKFPDIPGVYNQNGTINKEKVALVNAILVNYTTWVTDTTGNNSGGNGNPIDTTDWGGGNGNPGDSTIWGGGNGNPGDTL